MIKDHWINAGTCFVNRFTNAGSESIDSLIQKVKRKVRGYRSLVRFRTAIMLHLGGLDLLPDGTERTFGQ